MGALVPKYRRARRVSQLENVTLQAWLTVDKRAVSQQRDDGTAAASPSEGWPPLAEWSGGH